ncbi:hypothetical protein NPIL_408341 [Nephila pilipes]|uniref:Uncharacterized protein n=1 Tax=Nephila pilipes TaxID=299642 RepID=A0A8X6TQP5_NEPPI|nr:hypothetical protein NPIL_408341 [Nephila pilipes]
MKNDVQRQCLSSLCAHFVISTLSRETYLLSSADGCEKPRFGCFYLGSIVLFFPAICQCVGSKMLSMFGIPARLYKVLRCGRHYNRDFRRYLCHPERTELTGI